MPISYEDFDSAREVRLETLALVARLDQTRSEHRFEEGKWSIGEVLDHLVRLDDMVVREMQVTLEQRRRGLPFVYRGIADIDASIPWVLRPALPFFEVPFALFNTLVPQAARRAFTGNRSIPLQAPRFIEPRFGRPVGTLRDELAAAFDALEQQQADHPEIDLEKVYYYNPITGLNSVAGMYRFVSNHEQRHQAQLRDILGSASFPASTPSTAS